MHKLSNLGSALSIAMALTAALLWQGIYDSEDSKVKMQGAVFRH